MAITQVTNPPDPVAAYRANGVVLEFTSDDSDIVRMIADVYVDSTFIRSIEKDVLIGFSNKFRFDIAETLQDQLGFNLQTIGATGGQLAANSIKAYNLELFEVILTGSVFTTAHVDGGGGTPDLTTGADDALAIILNQEDNQNFIAGFHINDTTEKSLLTNAVTAGKKIQVGESEFISISKPTTTNSRIRITTFDTAGVQLNQADEDISSTFDSEKRFDYQVGTDNIGLTVTFDDNVAKYSVQFRNTGATLISQEHFFLVDRECHINSQRFHFLNKFGAIDSYTFTGNKTIIENDESARFEKPLAFNFDVKDHTTTKHDIEITETFRVTSGILLDNELEWLKELFRSALVWTELNGAYFPVVVETGSLELVKTNDGFNIIEMEYSRSFKSISHRN